MKFSVNREVLLPLVTRANNIIEAKSTQKVRTHAYLSVEGDKLTLVGFDHNLHMTASCTVQDGEDGKATVNARSLFDVIKSLPQETDVTLKNHENTLTISAGDIRVTLATIPAEEYPLPDAYEFDNRFDIAASELLRLLKLTQFSISINDVRQHLNGMLLEFSEKSISSVSSDGHRLSIAGIENKTDIKDLQIILPKKAVTEFINRLSTMKADDVCQIKLSANRFQLEKDNVTLSAALINAQFPNFRDIIPAPVDSPIIVPKETLNGALQRAKILSANYGQGVKLTITPWKLALSAKNLENEESQESIEINYDGDNITVSFNINYLSDILSVLTQDNVVLSILNDQSSCLVYGQDDLSARYVVMPMNL